MAKNTPENAAKAKVKALIAQRCEERGFKFKMTWHAGSAYESTVDADGVIAGNAVVIEVKRFDGKGKTSTRQKITLREYKEAGAATFLIDSEETLAAFDAWLQQLVPFVRWV